MESRSPVRPKEDTSRGLRFPLDPTPLHIRTAFAVARLDGSFDQYDVHPQWFAGLRREAYTVNAQSSTAIEGNALSLGEARDVIERFESGQRRPHDPAEREIVQHYEYFRDLERLPAETDEDLTIEEIVATHQRLLDGVVADRHIGRLRGPRLPEDVVFGGNEGTPHARVEAELRALLGWYYGEGQRLAPPIRIALWFHEFESIHPFADGNGRVGRALTHRLLRVEGLPKSLLVPLDAAFNQDRAAYYAALDAGRDGSRNAWLDYFLARLAGAYDEALLVLRRLTSVPSGFTGAQQAVVSYALRTGDHEVRVGPLARTLGDYKPITISLALKALADQHGLFTHNGKRGRHSAYRPSRKLYEIAQPRLAHSEHA